MPVVHVLAVGCEDKHEVDILASIPTFLCPGCWLAETDLCNWISWCSADTKAGPSHTKLTNVSIIQANQALKSALYSQTNVLLIQFW